MLTYLSHNIPLIVACLMTGATLGVAVMCIIIVGTDADRECGL